MRHAPTSVSTPLSPGSHLREKHLGRGTKSPCPIDSEKPGHRRRPGGCFLTVQRCFFRARAEGDNSMGGQYGWWWLVSSYKEVFYFSSRGAQMQILLCTLSTIEFSANILDSLEFVS